MSHKLFPPRTRSSPNRYFGVVVLLLSISFILALVSCQLQKINQPTNSPSTITAEVSTSTSSALSSLEVIETAKVFLSTLEIEGFSHWIILDDVSQIPSQKNDQKSPQRYADIVHQPEVLLNDGKNVVSLYTWTSDGGMLNHWKITIEGKRVTHVWAEVIDVGIGHSSLRTEGFVPAPGIILINRDIVS
jgi:hypothetical protein